MVTLEQWDTCDVEHTMNESERSPGLYNQKARARCSFSITDSSHYGRSSFGAMPHVVLLFLCCSCYSFATISPLHQFARFAYFAFTFAKPFFPAHGPQLFTSRVRVKPFAHGMLR